MGLFVYNQKGSIILIVVLPATEIIEPFFFTTLLKKILSHPCVLSNPMKNDIIEQKDRGERC